MMKWTDVINNPVLQDLPFKIELNKWGNILMSPASNEHGKNQAELVYNLKSQLPNGQVIIECSIQTSDGVKVADVVWASNDFIENFAYNTPYLQAPEVCIEIVSPSNSKIEMLEKVALYLAKDAQEVWLVYDDGNVLTFTHQGEIEQSQIAPVAQQIK